MSSKFIDYLKGYEKSEKRFKDGRVYRSADKFTDRLISGIGSSLSGKLMNNRAALFFSAQKERIVFASTRAYGMLFLSFGILTLLLHFADYYFRNLPSSPSFALVVGAIFAAISVPLLFTDVPFVDIFQKWSVTNFLIFDYLCIKRIRKTETDRKSLSLAVPILIGALLASLGFFFTVKGVLLSVIALLFLTIAFSSPEFSFIVTLLFLPVLPIVPHSSLILVALVLVTAVSFIGKVAVGKRLYHFEQYDVILLLFMLFVLVSGIFNKGLKSFESSLVFISVCLIYFLASNIIVNRRLADNSVNTVIISSVPTAIYAIVNYFVSPQHPEWLDPAFGDKITARATGTFGNPNIFAVYLLVAVLFSVSLTLSKSLKAFRPLYVIAALINTAALVLTWTRGAWLALIIGLISILITVSIKTPKILLIPLFALPILLVILPETVGERFLSIFSLADTSTSSRLSIWRSSIEMIKNNLFIGAGVGEDAFSSEFSKFAEDSVSAPHSHNLFLEIGCEFGIVALILFLAILIVRMRHRASYTFYVANSSVGSICTAAATSVFTLLIFGMTDYVWYSSPMLLLFWFAFGLGSASLRIARQEYDENFSSEHGSNSPYSASSDITISN